MRTEPLIFKRCCFCLPLRYGLITWGYLRLVVSMFLCFEMSIGFYYLLEKCIKESRFNIGSLVLGILVLLAITDIVLNVVFIVGGLKKNPRLLRAYYIYSLIFCILTGVFGAAISVIHIISLFKSEEIDLVFNLWVLASDTAAWLAQVLVQIYVLLLVKSEMMKLQDKCEFRFVNNATEAECNMKYIEKITGEGA